MSNELPHPILSIAHGASRIGLAITDPVGIMAHPLETVPNTGNPDDALKRIQQVVEERSIQAVLIGLPLHMDGSEGKAALKIRNFANRLKTLLNEKLRIEFVDERMTTVEASNKLREAGKKAKDQKDIIDQAAAVEILNHYLRAQQNPHGLLEEPPEDMLFQDQGIKAKGRSKKRRK